MTLFEAENCHVFRVPPQEYLKSETWEGNLIWTGNIRVFQDRVELYDASGVFGSCPLRDEPDAPKAVQPASDSRRCFVVRVEQGTQYAYLGLHFEDRDTAFRFSTAVIDRYKTAPDRAAEVVNVSDRRLRPGETFSVDLVGKVKVPTPGIGSTVGSRIADPLSAPNPAMPTNFNFNSGLQTRTGASRRVGAAPQEAPATQTQSAAVTQPVEAASNRSVVSQPTTASAPAQPTFDPFADLQPAAPPTSWAPPKAASNDFDPFAEPVVASVPTTRPSPAAPVVKPKGNVDLDDLFS